METQAYRKLALRPKRQGRKTRFIPALPEWDLNFALSKLIPEERKALDQIVNNADLIETEAGAFLLVKAEPELLDALATVGAEAEDREIDLEDERDEGEEDDSASDNAVDVLNVAPWSQSFGPAGNPIEDLEPESPAETASRKKYIADRTTVVERTAFGGEKYLERSFDSIKDNRDVMRVWRLALELQRRAYAKGGRRHG